MGATLGIPAGLQDWLSGHKTFTLATVNADGTAQACDLFFAHAEDFSCYFLSTPKTRHIENLLRDPRASATVHGAPESWHEIQGLQMVGEALPVTATGERALGFRLYLAKFVFVGSWLPSVRALGQVHAQLGLVELFKMKPRWMRWIDNTNEFGHKEEWSVE